MANASIATASSTEHRRDSVPRMCCISYAARLARVVTSAACRARIRSRPKTSRGAHSLARRHLASYCIKRPANCEPLRGEPRTRLLDARRLGGSGERRQTRVKWNARLSFCLTRFLPFLRHSRVSSFAGLAFSSVADRGRRTDKGSHGTAIWKRRKAALRVGQLARTPRTGDEAEARHLQ